MCSLNLPDKLKNERGHLGKCDIQGSENIRPKPVCITFDLFCQYFGSDHRRQIRCPIISENLNLIVLRTPKHWRRDLRRISMVKKVDVDLGRVFRDLRQDRFPVQIFVYDCLSVMVVYSVASRIGVFVNVRGTRLCTFGVSGCVIRARFRNAIYEIKHKSLVKKLYAWCCL